MNGQTQIQNNNVQTNNLVAQPDKNNLVKTQDSNPELPDSVMMSPLDIHFQRERISQMMTIADTLHKAGCFGSDVQNAFQAFVKIQTGAEMGMPPMEAMNSLYIVKGKITLWGAAVSKRIREHGWKIEYLEEKETEVTVKVSKNGEEHEYTATQEQLKKLGSKAAGFALSDKLRWHGLARLLRFHIPEVMGNAVSYIKEEMDDLPNISEKPAVRLGNAEFNASDFSAPTEVPENIEEEKPKEKEVGSVANEKPDIKPTSEDKKGIGVSEEVKKPVVSKKDKEVFSESQKEKISRSVSSFCKKIEACKSFKEINQLKEKFSKAVSLEDRGGLCDEQVKSIWNALGEKLKTFPKREGDEVADAEYVENLFT
jgi:hypothetical protein